MNKRKISLITTLIIILSIFRCYASVDSNVNKKLTENQMAITLYALELVKGDGTNLHLDDQLNRAEAVVLVTKIIGIQGIETTGVTKSLNFKDVKESDWYSPYIAYAYQNKIALGLSNDKFGANEPVTQKQFLKMLLSALNYEINKDYTWDTVEKFASDIGYSSLIRKDDKNENQNITLSRLGGFAIVFETLTLKSKAGDSIILEELVKQGVIKTEMLQKSDVSSILGTELIDNLIKISKTPSDLELASVGQDPSIVNPITVNNESSSRKDITAHNQFPLSDNLKQIENNESVSITSVVNEIEIGEEFRIDVLLHRGVNIYAEDAIINYNRELFEYIGYEEVAGFKVYKEIQSEGSIRFIIASQGRANALNGDKIFVHLKFRAKKEGIGKVDAVSVRIADNASLEKNIQVELCGEKEFRVINSKQ